MCFCFLLHGNETLSLNSLISHSVNAPSHFLQWSYYVFYRYLISYTLVKMDCFDELMAVDM